MIVFGWVILGTLVLLALIGIYKTVRLGWHAVKLFGLRGLLAGVGLFLSHIALTAILGKRVFEGYSFLSLSLILALPYFIGGINQGISHHFLKRNR